MGNPEFKEFNGVITNIVSREIFGYRDGKVLKRIKNPDRKVIWSDQGRDTGLFGKNYEKDGVTYEFVEDTVIYEQVKYKRGDERRISIEFTLDEGKLEKKEFLIDCDDQKLKKAQIGDNAKAVKYNDSDDIEDYAYYVTSTNEWLSFKGAEASNYETDNCDKPSLLKCLPTALLISILGSVPTIGLGVFPLAIFAVFGCYVGKRPFTSFKEMMIAIVVLSLHFALAYEWLMGGSSMGSYIMSIFSGPMINLDDIVYIFSDHVFVMAMGGALLSLVFMTRWAKYDFMAGFQVNKKHFLFKSFLKEKGMTIDTGNSTVATVE